MQDHRDSAKRLLEAYDAFLAVRKMSAELSDTADRKEPVVIHGIPSRTGTDATAIGG